MDSPRTSVLKRREVYFPSLSKAKIWQIVRNNLETVQDMMYSLIESHMRAFDWYQNRWPWMTLNVVMAIILRYYTEYVILES